MTDEHEHEREPVSMMEAQRYAIVDALRYTHGDLLGAAWKLGIGLSTLRRKIKAYEIRNVEWAAIALARAQSNGR